MMDIINFRCLQCGKQEKNERELKKHIQKKHAEIPEFRCIFCPQNKPRFSGKREQMYQVLALFTLPEPYANLTQILPNQTFSKIPI